MVLPREEFLGNITDLDKDNEGTITCNSAFIQDVFGVLHTARASAPTSYAAGNGIFWVEDATPSLPKFTDSAGTTVTLGAPIESQGTGVVNASDGSGGWTATTLTASGNTLTGSGGTSSYNVNNQTFTTVFGDSLALPQSNGDEGSIMYTSDTSGTLVLSSGFKWYLESAGQDELYLIGNGGNDVRVAYRPNGILRGWTGYINDGASNMRIAAVNGSVQIEDDGVIWDWPSTDGSNGQVLTTDGAGALTFTTIAAGGETLAQTLVLGNTTGGTDIDMTSGSVISSSDGYVVVDDVLDVSSDVIVDDIKIRRKVSNVIIDADGYALTDGLSIVAVNNEYSTIAPERVMINKSAGASGYEQTDFEYGSEKYSIELIGPFNTDHDIFFPNVLGNISAGSADYGFSTSAALMATAKVVTLSQSASQMTEIRGVFFPHFYSGGGWGIAQSTEVITASNLTATFTSQYDSDLDAYIPVLTVNGSIANTTRFFIEVEFSAYKTIL